MRERRWEVFFDVLFGALGIAALYIGMMRFQEHLNEARAEKAAAEAAEIEALLEEYGGDGEVLLDEELKALLEKYGGYGEAPSDEELEELLKKYAPE